MTSDAILERLAQYRALTIDPSDARAAAVLVPLRYDSGGELEMLFTRRTLHLPTHAGQVAFPGGGIEEGDSDAEAAALRETHEELGVNAAAVRLIGRLDDMITITGFHITPCVGLIDGQAEIIPDAYEVARVFSVPMNYLLDAAHWELRDHTYHGSTFQIWHLPYDSEDIWGVTGTILRGMVEFLWR